jgi:hypothetical protein
MPDFELQQSLRCIRKMTKLFRHLRERFTKANAAWARFNGARGDILYFEDLLSDPHGRSAQDALHKIEECFETLTDLEGTLERLQHTCGESAEMVGSGILCGPTC